MSSILKELLKLIEVEKEYAIDDVKLQLSSLDAKSAAKRGISMLNLRVSSQRTGLGGKEIVEFEHNTIGNLLPLNQIRTGDIVEILSNPSKSKKALKNVAEMMTGERYHGVVHRITDYKIVIVIDKDLPENFDQKNYRMYVFFT